MSIYRKLPVEIEAVRWENQPMAELLTFCPVARWQNDSIMISTLEGVMEARLGDWIIKGVVGEFYPCKPDIFEQTYELVQP